MTIQSDRQIKTLCVLPPTKIQTVFLNNIHPRTKETAWTDEEKAAFKPMIHPFVDHSVSQNEKGQKIPSYGLGSYSYDIRIGRNFKIMENPSDYKWHSLSDTIIDTNHDNPTYGLWKDHEDVDYIDIPPNGFVLGVAMEYLNMPNDITGVCMAKSTLARLGLEALVTPVEASWKGYLTIELKNISNFTIRLHSGIGIMALMFFKGDQVADVNYENRIYAGKQGAKYQDQPAMPVVARN